MTNSEKVMKSLIETRLPAGSKSMKGAKFITVDVILNIPDESVLSTKFYNDVNLALKPLRMMIDSRFEVDEGVTRFDIMMPMEAPARKIIEGDELGVALDKVFNEYGIGRESGFTIVRIQKDARSRLNYVEDLMINN